MELIETLSNAADGIEAKVFHEPNDRLHPFRLIARDTDADAIVSVVSFGNFAKAHDYAESFITGRSVAAIREAR